MSVVAAAVVGTALVGAYSTNKAAKSADRATRAQSDAAQASIELGREELDFTKQQWEEMRPTRDAVTQQALDIGQEQLAGMNFARAQAIQDQARRRRVFDPLEDRLVSEAQAYDTPARRAEEAARAAAGVEAEYGRAQEGLSRALMRTEGAGPLGSGRSVALMQDAALAKANARAGATSGAVRNVEQQGYARRMDTAALGRGLPSNQATQQQIAITAGDAANRASQSALTPQMQGAQMVQSGYGGAIQGAGQAGQLYGQAANTYNRIADSGAAGMGMLGGVLGQWAGSTAGSQKIAGWLSDEKKKKGRKPTDEDAALEQINALPVEDWQYDPAKGGPPDPSMHTGPMAQQVMAKMGPQAAPGGEVIDPVTMNGKLLAGMQALTKRVKKLEAEVA